MKNVKNNKGITLMALVITIILLIILASIGTYSGIQVVKSAQFTAFSTELKIMQTQVNSLYEKNKNNEKILLNNVETEIEDIGTAISSSSEIQTQANKAFNASGITDTPDYKYFDNTTIKNLNIEGVEGEFLVNIDKRSVVSYDGFEYEGKTYYTLEQLPDGLYNVEYEASQEQPNFDVNYETLENGKCKISVNNINYNGNINKWKVKYKKENEEDWKQSNNYSFIIDELGNYRVKIANNNTESREKQIVAKTLPSEYQQVEYIESTGTQYIDTGMKLDSNCIVEIDSQITEGGSHNIFGSRTSSTQDSFQAIMSDRDSLFAADFQNYQINRLSITPNLNRNIIKISNKFLQINDNKQIVQNYTDFETPYNAYIFDVSGNSAENYNKAKMKLYTCKIWKNNKLVRYFIPCYRKSDRKPGLYDIVNGVFYTNQGTDEFVFSIEKYNLPSQYQQVEYIKSTGTQFIDTGIKGNSELHIIADIFLYSDNSNSITGILGSREADTYNNSICFWKINKYIRGDYGENLKTCSFLTNNYTGRHMFDINRGVYTIDETSYTFSKEVYSNNYNLALFTVNNSNTFDSRATKANCYFLKIYDGSEVLQRFFVPCYKVSDNIVGLYDIVNNQFYTNQGTGDFEKGDDVIASDNTNDGMVIIINNL